MSMSTYGSVNPSEYPSAPNIPPPPYAPPPYQPSPPYQPTPPYYQHHYNQAPYPTGGPPSATGGPWLVYSNYSPSSIPPPQSISTPITTSTEPIHPLRERRRISGVTGGIISVILIIIIILSGYYIFKNVVTNNTDNHRHYHG